MPHAQYARKQDQPLWLGHPYNHSLPVIREPFTRIAMDVVGPLKRMKRGNKYVLVVMDYATKWPEAFALKNIASETIVDCLVELTDHLGIFTELLSDNGTNFISRVMKQYCETVGIKQIRTSPYHPQTDGMVERFNSTLKRLLRKLVQNTKVEWDQCLPYVLLLILEEKIAARGIATI